MDHRLQLGTRENPASDGRHGSRLGTKSSVNFGKEKNTETLCSAVVADESFVRANSSPHVAKQPATVGGEREADTGQHAIRHASTVVVERPLTCEEAAALIRAHPKTVKRMARGGNLPGHFRFGGFSALILSSKI